VVLAVFWRGLAGPAPGPAPRLARAAGGLWAAGWLLPAALVLEPVRATLAYGQVNIVLMALVTLDALTEQPRWPRGALTGLAAALKLTPAAFVLFFLLRRDYRAAVVAGGSFAAVTAAAAALAGPDSARYWTATVFATGRIGGPATAANQCLQAVLARAGLDPHTLPGAAAALILSAIVVAAAARGMQHALAAGQDGLALTLNAFAALLISPVSWSHHWVWSAPALLTLAGLARHHRRLAGAAAAAGLVLFTAAPQWWLAKYAGPAPSWAPWQQAIGSSYVAFAALILLLAASGRLTAGALDGRRPPYISIFGRTERGARSRPGSPPPAD
jgi:alpha-1,2-mannosyltransferase